MNSLNQAVVCRCAGSFDEPDYDIDGAMSGLSIENMIFAACRGGWPTHPQRRSESYPNWMFERLGVNKFFICDNANRIIIINNNGNKL